MNIRAKLIVLVVGMILLILSATSVYFVLQAPVERIEKERLVLNQIADATGNLQIEVNRLDSSIFVTGRPRFYAARVKFGEAFKYMRDIVYLRKSDLTLAASLDIIERLQKLNDENLTKVVELYDELYLNAETLFVFPDNVTFRRFYAEDPIADRNPEVKALAVFNLNAFDSKTKCAFCNRFGCSLLKPRNRNCKLVILNINYCRSFPRTCKI